MAAEVAGAQVSAATVTATPPAPVSAVVSGQALVVPVSAAEVVAMPPVWEQAAQAVVTGPTPSIPGPQGEPGPTARFVYHQETPAATWLVTHGLGKRVTPTLFMDAYPNEAVFTDVVHIDDNAFSVEWPSPTAGWVYM